MKLLRCLPALMAFAVVLCFTMNVHADLLGLYRFEGSSTQDAPVKGGIANGHVFDGTAFGDVVTLSNDVSGINGGTQSLSLGGTSDYIDLPASFAAFNPLDGSQDFTVTSWFKTAGNGDKSIILSSARDNVGANHAMAFHTGPACCGQAWSSGALIVDNFFVSQIGIGNNQGVNVEDDTWRFGAMTYEAAAGLYTIYVHDSGGFATDSLAFDPAIPAIQNDTVRIGGSRNADFPSPGDWNGNLDDVAIFNHVLTVAELDNVRAGNFDAYTDPNIHVGGAMMIGTEDLDVMVTGQVAQPLPGVKRIRVTKTDGFLSMREIEVVDDAGVNVGLAANGATPSASSIWPGGVHPLGALNDGITDGADADMTHTGNPPLPEEWLQINLPAPATVQNVHLYNRRGCCADQGQNLTLDLFNGSGSLLQSIPNVSAGNGVFQDRVITVGELTGGIAQGSMSTGFVYNLELDGNTGTSDAVRVPQIGTSDSTELNLNQGQVLITTSATPTLGQTFTVLEAEAIVGQLTQISLPDLSGEGLRVNADSLMVDGTVSIDSNHVHVGGDGAIGSEQPLLVQLSGQALQAFPGVKVVRATRSVPDFISLRELEAFDSSGVNVAAAGEGGVPAASSIWPGNIHPIQVLNDGINDDLGNNAHAHTGNPPLAEEWMQVTLANPADLESVHLYNRGNCCENQAQGLVIELFGDDGATELLAEFPASVPGGPGSDAAFDTRILGGGESTGSLQAGLVYHVELDPSNGINDAFTVPPVGTADTSVLNLEGDLVIELLSDPAAGQTFEILAVDVINGQFDNITLPGAASAWDLSNLYTDGTVGFVPEPTSLLGMVCGLCGFVFLCRHKAITQRCH